MKQNEKIGLGLLLALFVILIGLMVVTFSPVGNRKGGFSDNVLIDARQEKVDNQRR